MSQECREYKPYQHVGRPLGSSHDTLFASVELWLDELPDTIVLANHRYRLTSDGGDDSERMIRFNDYDVRVYEDGDTSISCHDEIQYGTMLGTYGIQCNAKDGTEEYERILKAAMNASDAMVNLDKAVRGLNGIVKK